MSTFSDNVQQTFSKNASVTNFFLELLYCDFALFVLLQTTTTTTRSLKQKVVFEVLKEFFFEWRKAAWTQMRRKEKNFFPANMFRAPLSITHTRTHISIYEMIELLENSFWRALKLQAVHDLYYFRMNHRLIVNTHSKTVKVLQNLNASDVCFILLILAFVTRYCWYNIKW